MCNKLRVILAFVVCHLLIFGGLQANEKHTVQKECKTCCIAKAIKEFPYIITKSGSYELMGDCTVPLCDSAITVSASNVVLDFKGYQLAGGSRGITVETNMEKISIKNGRIAEAKGDGIYVKDGCKDIQISDLSIVNCNRASCGGSGGIWFHGTALNPISFSTVINTDVIGCDGTAVRFEYCDDCKCVECSASSITSREDSHAIGFHVIGNEEVRSKNNCFEKCKASKIIATYQGQNAYGFFIDNGLQNTIACCEACNNSSLTQNHSSKTYGFYIYESECTLVKGCSGCANKASVIGGGGQNVYPLAAGFVSEWSTATTFWSCVACGNMAIASGESTQAYPAGFVLTSDTRSNIFYCLSQHNGSCGGASAEIVANIQDTGTRQGTGFLVGVFPPELRSPEIPGSTQCVLGRNKAIYNGRSGFYNTIEEDQIFFDNISIGHQRLGDGAPDIDYNYRNISSIFIAKYGVPFTMKAGINMEQTWSCPAP